MTRECQTACLVDSRMLLKYIYIYSLIAEPLLKPCFFHDKTVVVSRELEYNNFIA